MHTRIVTPISIDVYRLLVAQSQRQKDDAGLMLEGDRYLRPLLVTLTGIFQRGVQRREVDEAWDPILLAEQFFDAICAWDIRRLVFGYEILNDPAARRQRTDQRVDLFLAGMCDRSADEDVSDVGVASRCARSSR